MTTIPREPRLSDAVAALTELGSTGVKQPTRAELDHGLDELLARIAANRVRQRRLVRWSLAGAVATVSTLVVLLAASPARKPPPAPVALAYRIEGGSILEGGYLRETGHAGMKLLFSEGSTFVLTPGTRGSLRAVDQDGVRMAVDTGTASFRVTPSSNRHWLVEAGPFLVTVKGTAFVVSWEPSSERFELDLHQGSVTVSGPISGGSLALKAGQRLVVSLSKGQTLITEERPEQPLSQVANTTSTSRTGTGNDIGEYLGAPTASVLPSGAPQPSIAEASPAGQPPATVRAPSNVTSNEAERERHWARELASGHWDRILEDVERTGVDVALNGASSDDLFALADAARYRRRTDLARASLLAVRRRFPNSPRAIDALFLLGRVEESRGGGMARAIAWYDEYLARAPTGAYAAEALGRKMITTKETAGATQARAIAEEYLRRFPKGSYAGTARAWLREP